MSLRDFAEGVGQIEPICERLILDLSIGILLELGRRDRVSSPGLGIGIVSFPLF